MKERNFYRDVLNEGVGAEFEEALFRKTLTTARRVRRTRIAVRSGLAAIAIALLALQTWPRKETVIVETPRSEAAPLMASHKKLETLPFPNVLRTAAIPAGRSLATVPARVSTTAQAGPPTLRLINDDQLLALFEGQSVALVNHGGRSELIVLGGVQ